jgi:hypothetical protein
MSQAKENAAGTCAACVSDSGARHCPECSAYPGPAIPTPTQGEHGNYRGSGNEKRDHPCCRCRKRAMSTRTDLVCIRLSMSPAEAKSSFWGLLGRLFQCRITAAPRQRRLRSCFASSSGLFSSAMSSMSSCSSCSASPGPVARRVQRIPAIALDPLFVVRELREAPSQIAVFDDFIRELRTPAALVEFGGLRSVLLCVEHENSQCH